MRIRRLVAILSIPILAISMGMSGYGMEVSGDNFHINPPVIGSLHPILSSDEKSGSKMPERGVKRGSIPSPVKEDNKDPKKRLRITPVNNPITPHGYAVTEYGTASWYCLKGVSKCPRVKRSGLYAAAGPALRVGDWRGRSVRVCKSGTSRCIKVVLVDWCACPNRVIDLFGYAFAKLTPRSMGLVKVTVSW